MSSPCADSSGLNTQNAENHSLMSTSLRERLKKCGRYHPPGAASSGSPTNTPPSATRIYNPNSLPVKDSGGSIHLNEAYLISKNDADTPKRRTPETFSDASTSITKRRKLNYSKGFLGNVSNIEDQTDIEISAVPSSRSGDINVDLLRNDERQATDVAVSSKTEHLQQNGVILCLDATGSEVPTGNNTADENCIKLKDLKIQMEKELKAKEELMRKLKMVKMYREKNNLTELQKLIDTWRDVSQKALADLHDLHPPPRPSLTELINHLQIDHDLIHYVADDEMFS